MVQQLRYIPSFKDIPAERQQLREAPVEERIKNFKEVELGLTQEQAMQEALRCLSCRKCLGCGLCVAVCHANAIDLADKDREIEVEVDSIVLAPSAESGLLTDQSLGYGVYSNVLDFVEFRYILNDAGPYAGLLLRPSDGEIPRKIAFVGFKDRDNYLLQKYALEEARQTREKMKELEIHLFFAGLSANDLEKYHKTNPEVFFSAAEVAGLTETADRNLILQLREGKKVGEEEFEMVVLFGWLCLPSYIKDLSEKLDLKLGNSAFLEAEKTSLKETNRPNVFLLGHFNSSQANSP